MTPPLWQKVKEESEKVGLKLNIQKIKIMAFSELNQGRHLGNGTMNQALMSKKKRR